MARMFEAAMSRSSENVSRASRVQNFINVVDRGLYGGVSGKLYHYAIMCLYKSCRDNIQLRLSKQ